MIKYSLDISTAIILCSVRSYSWCLCLYTFKSSNLWHVTVTHAGLWDIIDVSEEFVQTRYLRTHLLHCVRHTQNWRRHFKKKRKILYQFNPFLYKEHAERKDCVLGTDWLSLGGSWCWRLTVSCRHLGRARGMPQVWPPPVSPDSPPALEDACRPLLNFYFNA